MDKVVLSKVDEVHLKVHAERYILREMADEFSFLIPNAHFNPKVRRKQWDGRIRLLDLNTRLIYVGLAEDIEKFCIRHDYELVYDYDHAATEFSAAEAVEYIKTLDLPFAPKDYQMKCFVDAIRDKRVTFVSPTASGKSYMIYLITRYLGLKTLIIVPTIGLVSQMRGDLLSYGMTEDEIHMIYGGSDIQAETQVIISTWQSIYKLHKKYFDQYKVIFGDEVHLFKATSLVKIMTNAEKCKYRFGFTGTLDNISINKLVIKGLFGKIRQVATTKKLVERGDIAKFDIKCILLDHNKDDVVLPKKYDYKDELNFLIASRKRNNFIKNLSLSLKGNTLILHQFVEKHGDILYGLIKIATNRPVYYIHGGIAPEEREKIRHAMETHDDAILVASYNTTSTGINIRRLHNLIFASPSKSMIRILQSIGRTLRLHESKESSTIYDISDKLPGKNYTLQHYAQRLKIYVSEKIPYKQYEVKLK